MAQLAFLQKHKNEFGGEETYKAFVSEVDAIIFFSILGVKNSFKHEAF
jgi:hypothetical protein